MILALGLYCRKQRQKFWPCADFIAPAIPLGLACGRIGNFINGELYGRVTSLPWGMIFPNAGPSPRHPSQLYECLIEGGLLYLILKIYNSKPRRVGQVSGLFLLGYGLARFGIEFFREPDGQLGFIALGWLTMGQILSVPMILFGIFLMRPRNASLS